MPGTEIATHLETTIGVNADPALARELFVRGLMKVETIGDSAPPGSPVAGARYVIGTGAGAWAGHDGEIATYNSLGELSFLAGVDSSSMVVNAANGRVYLRHGGAWVALDEAAIAAAAAAMVVATQALADASTALAAADAATNSIAFTRGGMTAPLAVAGDGELGDVLRAVPGGLEFFPGADTSVLNLWYDAVAGDDNNDGLAMGAPVQTPARLMQILRRYRGSYRPITVNLASGLLDLTGYQLPAVTSSFLTIYANPDWDPRGDLFTVVSAGTAQAGTTAHQLVTAETLTIDQYRGFTLRMTSGASAGHYRTISRNTAGADSIIQTAVSFNSPTIAATDNYEIVTSNAVVRGSQINVDSNESFAFVGVDFDTTGSLFFGQGFTYFWGCRARSSVTLVQNRGAGSMAVGTNNSDFTTATGIDVSKFVGWGWATDATGFTLNNAAPSGLISGYLVAKGVMFANGRTIVSGGHLGGLNCNLGNTFTSFPGGGNALNPLTIGDVASTSTRATISAGHVNVSGQVRFQGTVTTNPLIDVTSLGRLFMGSGAVGANAGSGPTLRTRYGGQAYWTAAPSSNFGKAPGSNDLVSEGATGDRTTLNVAGAKIHDASNQHSIIQRT